MMETTIRPESAADAAAIRALLRAAFGGADEATVVEQWRLRSDAWSLVATQAEVVVGAITLLPRAKPAAPRRLHAVGLAPGAVIMPTVERQHSGRRRRRT